MKEKNAILWFEFGPEFLKNVQYLEILNPNRQWALDYQMGFFFANLLPFEAIDLSLTAKI